MIAAVRKVLLIAGTALLAGLSGCASTGQKSETMSPRRVSGVDDAALNAIYADIERATAQGQEGIRLYRDGDDDGAGKAMTASRELLTAVAGRCVTTPGCEIERVLVAQDALLDRQAQELLAGTAEDKVPVDEPQVPESAPAATTGSPVVSAIPEAARSIALLNGRDLGSMVTLNEPIRVAMEEWLTWMRPNLLEAYENYQYMRHKMWPVYERAGLPEALLFGILAKESGAKVHAVSRAGASGPLQFMYYTGARYGLNKSAGFDLRFDPTEATRANVAYLNDQFRLLNNNLELSLGAYNGGEGRMLRLSPGGKRSFWDPQVYYRLPPETRDYVPMVLAAAWLFLHPADYNVKFPTLDTRPSSIALRQTASLNELSICLGQEGNDRGWFRVLRNLNPRYDPNERLPAGTNLDMPQSAAAAYARNCTAGPLMVMSQQLHDARAPVPPSGMRVPGAGSGTASSRTHIVQRGETLSSIARKFGCSDVRPIATVNRIKAPRYSIRAGQRLVVPSCRV